MKNKPLTYFEHQILLAKLRAGSHPPWLNVRVAEHRILTAMQNKLGAN